MGFFSPPSIPKIPPPPPAANPPILADPAVQGAGANQRTRAAMAAGMGFGGTVQNAGGSQGLVTPANTAQKSLLG